jgi:hypothetical protein
VVDVTHEVQRHFAAIIPVADGSFEPKLRPRIVTVLPPEKALLNVGDKPETPGASNENLKEFPDEYTPAAERNIRSFLTPTSPVCALHDTVVAEDHDVVEHCVPLPTAVVGVGLLVPKSRPEIVTEVPNDVAALYGFTLDKVRHCTPSTSRAAREHSTHAVLGMLIYRWRLHGLEWAQMCRCMYLGRVDLSHTYTWYDTETAAS